MLKGVEKQYYRGGRRYLIPLPGQTVLVFQSLEDEFLARFGLEAKTFISLTIGRIQPDMDTRQEDNSDEQIARVVVENAGLYDTKTRIDKCRNEKTIIRGPYDTIPQEYKRKRESVTEKLVLDGPMKESAGEKRVFYETDLSMQKPIELEVQLKDGGKPKKVKRFAGRRYKY